MSTLTRAQREVLEALRHGPAETSTSTAHGWINGSSALALERKGLVERVPGRPCTYRITESGRRVLDESPR